MSKHPKTIAFFDKGKSLLNDADLSILKQNTPKKTKKRPVVKSFRVLKKKTLTLSGNIKDKVKKAVMK